MPPSKCLFLLLNLVVAYAASVEIVGDTLIMSDNAKHYYNGLERTNEQIRQIYSQWMVEHAKHHNTISENDHRFEIFKDNLRFIDAHNSKGHSYQLGLNKFADLTNEEYRSMYLGVNGREGRVRNGENKSNRYAVSAGESLPNNIDWRIKNGPPGHDDCGLCDQFIRPPCCNELENKKAVSIDSFEDVPANNEKALQKAVAHQVVRASIEAAGRAFQLYKSGIFTGQCGTTLDHKVIVEGYGTENGKDYWIVHNSWGPKWGESGYIRLERNIASPSGKCGIAMKSSYPVKKHRNPPKPAMENATH